MTIRLTAALPPLPAQYVVSLPAWAESALVSAGLASTDLDDVAAYQPLPSSLVQRPLMLVRITPAQRAAPTTAMLDAVHVVYDDGTQWWQANSDQTDLVPVAVPRNGWPRALPLRNGLVSPGVQFQGATDTSASLGQLGLVVNAANDAAAAAMLQAGTSTIVSTINGASADGVWHSLRSLSTITTVHVGQIGMVGTYVLQASGACSAASLHFARLEFDAGLGINHLQWTESEPTDFAGTPGTGSARQVSVIGMVE